MRLHVVTLELIHQETGITRHVAFAHHDELVAKVLAAVFRYTAYNAQLGNEFRSCYTLRGLSGPAAVEVVEAMPRGKGDE